MSKLGLKSGIGIKQFENRMKENPSLLELHLEEAELFGVEYYDLKKRIQDAQSKGVTVVLHQPRKLRDAWLNLRKKNCIEEDYLRATTRVMMELCEKYDLKCVIHFNYGESINEKGVEELFETEAGYKEMVQRAKEFIEEFDPSKKHIVFENGIVGACYRKDMIFANLLKETDLPLCMDVSHLAISLNDFEDTPNHVYIKEEIAELNDYIEETIKLLDDNIKYYHVVDTKAENRIHDSLGLGDGVIDWKRIKEYIVKKEYIYEIGLKDFGDCKEMVESHEYFSKI